MSFWKKTLQCLCFESDADIQLEDLNNGAINRMAETTMQVFSYICGVKLVIEKNIRNNKNEEKEVKIHIRKQIGIMDYSINYWGFLFCPSLLFVFSV